MTDINGIRVIALSTLVALSTLIKLIELIKRDNCYNYSMQISTSTDNRVYIGFCTILNTNNVIIHEEYDLSPKLDNTRIVSIEFLNEYIKNMNDIVYIGLQESSNTDESLVVYYER